MDIWLVPGNNKQDFHDSTMSFNTCLSSPCQRDRWSLCFVISGFHGPCLMPQLRLTSNISLENKFKLAQEMLNVWYFQVGSLEDCVGHITEGRCCRDQRSDVVWSSTWPWGRWPDISNGRETGKKKNSVNQTKLDYLVYSITSQGLIDNTERCCRNHSVIGNRAAS